MKPKAPLTLIMLAALAVPASAAEFEGPTWQLTDLRGFDASRLPSGPKSVTARFEKGRISGFSGCNRYFGSYVFRQERLVIDKLAGSMMACDPASMAVESAVHRALAGTFRPVVAEGRLSLKTEAGETALSFKAEPTPTLEGLSTTITGFNNRRQAVLSPKIGTTINLSFQGGLVKGFAGCNTFRATYKVAGDQIAFGPVATTRRMCTGEGVMQQEREFLSALKSTTTWSISGGLLDMHRPDGERTLVGTRGTASN
ncbi:META domain-containing protein [Variovorax sp. GT1P44]|uniref:META domain-containing protein n=1 Tax=Variovorax sp. GT1P44 TaxID=3443742 RepID=UPI003F458F2D